MIWSKPASPVDVPPLPVHQEVVDPPPLAKTTEFTVCAEPLRFIVFASSATPLLRMLEASATAVGADHVITAPGEEPAASSKRAKDLIGVFIELFVLRLCDGVLILAPIVNGPFVQIVNFGSSSKEKCSL